MAAAETPGSTFPHFATKALHDGQEPENWSSHEVVPPISLATTYKQAGPGEHKGFDYSRAGNPTRNCLQVALAGLENAKHAFVYSSGLATTGAILGLLNAGDHIVISDDVYGGTNRMLKRIVLKHGVTNTMVCMTDLEKVATAFQPNTKLVWAESPTNPLMKLCDIKALCTLVHSKCPTAYVVVDNTFMSPYCQRPIDLGVDMVMHSITKYINGHTDVLMGVVMTNRADLAEHFLFYQLAYGAVPSPFDCFLVNRGIKTLHLRMQRHGENALKIAQFLENHPYVEKVLCPGLPSHPQHELHKRQTKASSGMLSFYLKGGLAETKKFFSALKIFILAESLGGYESLVDHPAIMTHASVPAAEREKLKITDNLIRLSVGIEDPEDLMEDLDQALRYAETEFYN